MVDSHVCTYPATAVIPTTEKLKAPTPPAVVASGALSNKNLMYITDRAIKIRFLIDIESVVSILSRHLVAERLARDELVLRAATRRQLRLLVLSRFT